MHVYRLLNKKDKNIPLIYFPSKYFNDVEFLIADIHSELYSALDYECYAFEGDEEWLS